MTAEVQTTAAESQGGQPSYRAMALCGRLHVGQILPPASVRCPQSNMMRLKMGLQSWSSWAEVLQTVPVQDSECSWQINDVPERRAACLKHQPPVWLQAATPVGGTLHPEGHQHSLPVKPYTLFADTFSASCLPSSTARLNGSVSFFRSAFALHGGGPLGARSASTRRAARSAPPPTASHVHGYRARQQATLSTTICRASRCAAQGTLTSKSCTLTNHPLLAASSSARSRSYDCLTDQVFSTDLA
jgi:hypothetical protein